MHASEEGTSVQKHRKSQRIAANKMPGGGKNAKGKNKDSEKEKETGATANSPTQIIGQIFEDPNTADTSPDGIHKKIVEMVTRSGWKEKETEMIANRFKANAGSNQGVRKRFLQDWEEQLQCEDAFNAAKALVNVNEATEINPAHAGLLNKVLINPKGSDDTGEITNNVLEIAAMPTMLKDPKMWVNTGLMNIQYSNEYRKQLAKFQDETITRNTTVSELQNTINRLEKQVKAITKEEIKDKKSWVVIKGTECLKLTGPRDKLNTNYMEKLYKKNPNLLPEHLYPTKKKQKPREGEANTANENERDYRIIIKIDKVKMKGTSIYNCMLHARVNRDTFIRAISNRSKVAKIQIPKGDTEWEEVNNTLEASAYIPEIADILRQGHCAQANELKNRFQAIVAYAQDNDSADGSQKLKLVVSVHSRLNIHVKQAIFNEYPDAINRPAVILWLTKSDATELIPTHTVLYGTFNENISYYNVNARQSILANRSWPPTTKRVKEAVTQIIQDNNAVIERGLQAEPDMHNDNKPRNAVKKFLSGTNMVTEEDIKSIAKIPPLAMMQPLTELICRSNKAILPTPQGYRILHHTDGVLCDPFWNFTPEDIVCSLAELYDRDEKSIDNLQSSPLGHFLWIFQQNHVYSRAYRVYQLIRRGTENDRAMYLDLWLTVMNVIDPARNYTLITEKNYEKLNSLRDLSTGMPLPNCISTRDNFYREYTKKVMQALLQNGVQGMLKIKQLDITNYVIRPNNILGSSNNPLQILSDTEIFENYMKANTEFKNADIMASVQAKYAEYKRAMQNQPKTAFGRISTAAKRQRLAMIFPIMAQKVCGLLNHCLLAAGISKGDAEKYLHELKTAKARNKNNVLTQDVIYRQIEGDLPQIRLPDDYQQWSKKDVASLLNECKNQKGNGKQTIFWLIYMCQIFTTRFPDDSFMEPIVEDNHSDTVKNQINALSNKLKSAVNDVGYTKEMGDAFFSDAAEMMAVFHARGETLLQVKQHTLAERDAARKNNQSLQKLPIPPRRTYGGTGVPREINVPLNNITPTIFEMIEKAAVQMEEPTPGAPDAAAASY